MRGAGLSQLSVRSRVDAVWKAQIANLGIVNYVFDVHRSDSIDSIILNLQKSKRNPTAHKIIAVSDAEQLETIKNEIEGLPEEFVRSLSYWDVVDVKKTHKNMSEVITSIRTLELVKSEFEFQVAGRKWIKRYFSHLLGDQYFFTKHIDNFYRDIGLSLRCLDFIFSFDNQILLFRYIRNSNIENFPVICRIDHDIIHH